MTTETPCFLFPPERFSAPPPHPGDLPGRVTEVHRERWRVACAHGEVWARLKGTLQHAALVAEDLPTVGDFVYLQYEPQGDTLVTAVLPRSSKFSRRDNKTEQLVAANFDAVLITSSLNADFNLARIERYLAAAWQSGAQPVVVLTKADLCADPFPYIAQVERVAPGVTVHAVSAHTGDGLTELAAYLAPGRTVALLGMSGTGKSSLVNAFLGEQRLDVGDIREDDARGRHTTTHRQLLPLPSGACIIDTPGMRELGLWAVDHGVAEAFADIHALAEGCRFADCAHHSEPDCAVRAAVAAGELSAKRLSSYHKLVSETGHAALQAAAPWQQAQRRKAFGKMIKAALKEKSR